MNSNISPLRVFRVFFFFFQQIECNKLTLHSLHQMILGLNPGFLFNVISISFLNESIHLAAFHEGDPCCVWYFAYSTN